MNLASFLVEKQDRPKILVVVFRISQMYYYQGPISILLQHISIKTQKGLNPSIFPKE